LGRSRAQLDTAVLLVCLTIVVFSVLMPHVGAWNISVSASDHFAWPGKPAVFVVDVVWQPPEVMGTWTVQLWASQNVPGMTVTFSVNNQPPAFTSTMTVQVDATTPPGPQTFDVIATPSYATQIPGPDDKVVSTTVSVGYVLDWALSDPTIAPPSPNVGDQVLFSVVAAQNPSTNWVGEFVLIFKVVIDGQSFDVVQNSFPKGTQYLITQTVTATKAWTATAGSHVVGWEVVIAAGDPSIVIYDPTPDDKVSLTFTVGGGVPFDFALGLSPSSVTVKQGGTASYKILLTYSDPSYSGTVINIQLTGLGSGMNWQLTQAGDLTITTSSTTPTGAYTIGVIGSAEGVTHQASGSLTVTSEQATSQASAQTQTQVSTTPTQTVTHIETTTQAAAGSTPAAPATVVQTVTQSSTGTQPLLVIQQNDLLTISLIGAGLILIAALVLRRLRQAPPPTPPSSARQTSTPAGFCADCGAPLQAGAKFCGKCGSVVSPSK
jgi:hypothetical protein